MSDESLVVTIGLDGRIHIPAEACRQLGLQPGTEVEIRRREHGPVAGASRRAPSADWIHAVLSDVLLPDDRSEEARRTG